MFLIPSESAIIRLQSPVLKGHGFQPCRKRVSPHPLELRSCRGKRKHHQKSRSELRKYHKLETAMTETSRMTVGGWTRKRFDESSSSYNGALALFMEGPTVTLVRVSHIETDSWGVRVRITCEPTPGIGLLSQDEAECSLSAAWNVFSSFGEMWSAQYVGWKLFFDAWLLADMKSEAAEAAREGKTLDSNQVRDLIRRHREAKDRLESPQ